VQPVVTASAGVVTNATGTPIPAARQYRTSFELEPENKDVIELRLVLMANGKPWSETWLYRWTK